VTVGEDAIVDAMRAVWTRLKLVIEPSSAVAIAALLAGALPLHGRRVGVVLSGGNVDLDRLPWGAPQKASRSMPPQ
jgi:threonine dehydratase